GRVPDTPRLRSFIIVEAQAEIDLPLLAQLRRVEDIERLVVGPDGGIAAGRPRYAVDRGVMRIGIVRIGRRVVARRTAREGIAAAADILPAELQPGDEAVRNRTGIELAGQIRLVDQRRGVRIAAAAAARDGANQFGGNVGKARACQDVVLFAPTVAGRIPQGEAV